MAELTITIPEAKPDEDSVRLIIDQPVPAPAFVDIEDADGTVHRYVPAEVERQRDLLLAFMRDFSPWAKRHFPLNWNHSKMRAMRAAIAECEGDKR